MMFASVGASPTPLACPARGAPTRPAPRVGSSRKFGTRSRVPSVSSSARAAPEPTPEDDAEDDAASAPAPASLRASRRALLAATPAAFGLAARPSPTSASIPTSTSATPLADVASAGALVPPPTRPPDPRRLRQPPRPARVQRPRHPRPRGSFPGRPRARRRRHPRRRGGSRLRRARRVRRPHAEIPPTRHPPKHGRDFFLRPPRSRTSELLPILYTPNVATRVCNSARYRLARPVCT